MKKKSGGGAGKKFTGSPALVYSVGVMSTAREKCRGQLSQVNKDLQCGGNVTNKGEMKVSGITGKQGLTVRG